MRPDEDDFLWSACPENLDFQVAAIAARDSILLTFYQKSCRRELGFDAISRLRQLMRAVSHVPLANVNSEVGHVLRSSSASDTNRSSAAGSSPR